MPRTHASHHGRAAPALPKPASPEGGTAIPVGGVVVIMAAGSDIRNDEFINCG
jgi:hypothetical protein